MRAIKAWVRRITAIPQFMTDKRVPLRRKALVLFGLIYLVLPLDLIPPIIPVFGWVDDLILWIYIPLQLQEDLDRNSLRKKKANANVGKREKGIKVDSGKKIIEVDFGVKEVKKETQKEASGETGPAGATETVAESETETVAETVGESVPNQIKEESQDTDGEDQN